MFTGGEAMMQPMPPMSCLAGCRTPTASYSDDAVQSKNGIYTTSVGATVMQRGGENVILFPATPLQIFAAIMPSQAAASGNSTHPHHGNTAGAALHDAAHSSASGSQAASPSSDATNVQQIHSGGHCRAPQCNEAGLRFAAGTGVTVLVSDIRLQQHCDAVPIDLEDIRLVQVPRVQQMVTQVCVGT